MRRRDVVIVGAGPAGSALAALLARQGLEVLLLDRARFPRAKVCGEYMSPQALASLDRLGALGLVEALGPRRLRGLSVRSEGGRSFRADYETVDGFAPHRPYGFGLSRERFDAALLGHAAAVPGVTLREGFAVTRLIREAGKVSGVAGTAGQGREETLRARLVVGADGVRSIVARLAGLSRVPRLRKFAFMARLEGLRDENRGELHLGRDCYAGIAPVEGGLANVNLVVDRDAMASVRDDRGRFYEETLASIPGMRDRLAGARRATPVRVTGPVAWDSRASVADGVLLVGDAAGFVDPFTGEGIFMALRGAELAAEEIPAALARDGGLARGLAGYRRRREAEFGRKIAACRGIQRLLYRRRLADWIVSRLDRRTDVARRLVAASGDYLPPDRALRLASLASLLSPFPQGGRP